MKRTALVLALAAPLLSACAGTARLVENGASAPIGADAVGGRMPRVKLRACVGVSQSWMKPAEAQEYFQNWMSEVFERLAAVGQPCDVTMMGRMDLYTRTLEFLDPAGAKLFEIETRFSGAQSEVTKNRVNAHLRRRFTTDAELLARLKPGSPAPAPAAAPVPGMSREELAAMVAAAVKQNQAAGPAVASPQPRFSAPERPDDLAVIVGVESYSEIATKAPYAERDADAFKTFVRALGVLERNIVLLKGPKAGKAALEKNLEVWLPRLAKPESRVYFYFSGHGAPEVKSGQAYLVPWDGDPNFLEATAYPVSRLYQKLGALPAKQVLVAMDSCFSGAGGRSVLASGARPLVAKVETGEIPAKLTVLAASAASEISGSLDDRQHGAFTYFLLEGLNAGKTGAKALHAYLTPKVQDEARRLNRDQTPQFLGTDLTLR